MIKIIKKRLAAVNILAGMLDDGLITTSEYCANVYHLCWYWYHGDVIANHKQSQKKHEKWLDDNAEIYKFREELETH